MSFLFENLSSLCRDAVSARLCVRHTDADVNSVVPLCYSKSSLTHKAHVMLIELAI